MNAETRTVYWGIFGSGNYPSLSTPDKQLHVHGQMDLLATEFLTFGIGPVKRSDDFWESMAMAISFLETQIPSDVFTLVFDYSPMML